jgi:SAM-dependent methyltransferase
VEIGKKMIFSKFYADCYDQIHSSKSYEEESKKLINFIAANLSERDISKILDFGCGTGTHLNSLVDEKFELYGYDRNEYMLDVARQKFPKLFVSSNFSLIPDELDLVYSLFDVVNYQVTDEEVETFFRLLASKLASGAMLVIDGWHYSGVVQDPPIVRERNINFGSSVITRRVVPSTNDDFHTTVLEITLEDRAISKILAQENHIMRSFSVGELEVIAENCGFSEVTFKDGADWDKELTINSWRFVMFAKKN